jgi:methyltransferase (TIGR00027 family)
MDLISATARLAAFHRARETSRPDAVFRDRYARALAGAPDAIVSRTLAAGEKADWFYTARTYAIDRLLAREIAGGADLVVQLAAGLDARPYRLTLPPALRWVEIDLPEVIDYKNDVLAGAASACRVDRIDVDLSNPDARRGVFADLGRRSSRAVVISEGLLIHLMAGEVGALSRDLAGPPAFQRWIADIASSALIDILNETSGELVREAGAPYVFAPPEGPAFFRDDGWQVLGVRSLVKAAAKLERLPMALRLTAMLPDGSVPGDRPWAGACLLGKDALEAGVE